jgi:hypothetical protein
VPEKSKQSRLEKNPQSRFPPLDWGGHLIGWLFEAGPVLSTGMGLAPLCDRDLVAWQENQGLLLTGWECSTLIRLSRIYASGLSQYTDPKSAPPWAPPADPEAMKRATASRQEMMKRLASR